ncbi:Zinc metalloproteinase nas-37 [Toxocara canis]|uniref:Zinc metalloproteinase n=1 Tax=Toxocara canis TaxID=6265 RepID=A0A0B2VUY5_TOXCA|nr:Zinc metalloproteinase nas-37 [Toxocara canis]
MIAYAAGLSEADLDFQSDEIAANSYAEVRVLLDKYYKVIARKHSAYNDYNAKEVSAALKNTSFDDGTEASTNRKQGIGGELFENDILLTLPQAHTLLKEEIIAKHKLAKITSGRGSWFLIILPLSNVTIWQGLIRKALNHVENETCIRFQENKDADDYIQFIRGSGCWSNVGHIGGRQQISIGYGCDAIGIIAHEVLHALGLWHEQSRFDRDQFITLNYDNVYPGTQGNFEKRSELTTDNMGQPYDLGSVMHYGSTAFAIDYSKSTIRTIDNNFQQTIGQRKGISFKDAKMINLRYCSNPSTCGGELSATDNYTTIISPPLERGIRCVWRIKSPVRVQLSFDRIDLPCGVTCLSYVELKFSTEKTSTG